LSVLHELVGRSRSEVGSDTEPAVGPAVDLPVDLPVDPVVEEWDWDAEWAATQADRQDAAPGTAAEPQDADAGSAPDRTVEGAGTSSGPRLRLALPGTVPPALRRPPGHRAPVLLAVAVIGAVLTGLLGVGGGDAAPVASGQDYGLGISEASFSGGVDVAGARGEISQAEAQARLSEIAASRAAREPDFVVPTDGRLTTCFCQRWGSMHWGIDLAAPLGTPIFAAADGVVLRAGPASGYGNAVYIQDADGNVEIYGHMKYYSVAAGDVVSAGDQIAKVGNQGQSTGPHLHFEIHTGGMNGKPTDPADWLAERGLSVG
jgi:murein DD-endopeptidase MepM/ murein hydrolase activator NlpD